MPLSHSSAFSQHGKSQNKQNTDFTQSQKKADWSSVELCNISVTLRLSRSTDAVRRQQSQPALRIGDRLHKQCPF